MFEDSHSDGYISFQNSKEQVTNYKTGGDDMSVETKDLIENIQLLAKKGKRTDL